MKKVMSLIALMTFVSACAEPPPEHPTTKQWCARVQEYACTEEQGFTSKEDCEEEMGFVEEVSMETGCKSDYEEILVCNWYLGSSCTTNDCDYAYNQWSDCVE